MTNIDVHILSGSVFRQFHKENLLEIDGINREFLSHRVFTRFLGKVKALRALEQRVNSRSRYYGVIYDLHGNHYPAGRKSVGINMERPI